ncbi:uncharacterized protein LOC136040807 [Artemia franciscana]|uniref:EB domain-containing protein n=1 Tax=Artemia franciscana TaxID=6661 RepID=A0AA88HPP6_ARTSF|nr:hypothetical protein QYM36_009270 [Artemia franciscana]
MWRTLCFYLFFVAAFISTSVALSADHWGNYDRRSNRTHRAKRSGQSAEAHLLPSTISPGRLGDPCDSEEECGGIMNSFCDMDTGSCTCLETHPVRGITMCGKEVQLNDFCQFGGQCRALNTHSECRGGRCTCKPGYNTRNGWCVEYQNAAPGSHVDPIMIGVLVAMAVMFIIICVVLRLFSKARFRDNRTIFNTPNPRLMNASLLKEPMKAERKGSLRPESRMPSMTSLQSQCGSIGPRRKNSPDSRVNGANSAAEMKRSEATDV